MNPRTLLWSLGFSLVLWLLLLSFIWMPVLWE